MSTSVFPQVRTDTRAHPSPNVLKFDLQSLTHLISGNGWQRKTKPVCMPFTGEVLGEVPDSKEDDVLAAVNKARQAQRNWARTSLAMRKAILIRYHDLVLQKQDEMADLLQLEGGKARLHAMEEVLDVVNVSRYYAYNAYRYLKPSGRKGAMPFFTAATVYRKPVGVVGIIAPWNYPLTLAVTDALPALMAGNTVVMKPAEETPFIALFAVQLLRQAGLPDDVFQVVTGRGSVLGPPLIQNVDFIHFTGSTNTGRIIAKQAGERLIKYAMELGGKNPIIVLNDANLERAVDGVVRGAFSNAGQLCVSFERLYVQSGIFQAFVEKLIERVNAIKLGSALDYSVDMGTLASQDQLNKVSEHVQDAVAKGAQVLAGGSARPDLGPYFFQPTLLANVTPGMHVYADETFGPVLSIYSFDQVDQAIRLANDSQYGLNASVWTSDTNRGKRIALQIEAGTVSINEAYIAPWGSVDAPIGGMKSSGVGRRHGAEGILRFTEPQTITTQHGVPLAPYGRLKPRHYVWGLSLVLMLLRRIPWLR